MLSCCNAGILEKDASFGICRSSLRDKMTLTMRGAEPMIDGHEVNLFLEKSRETRDSKPYQGIVPESLFPLAENVVREGRFAKNA